MSWRTCNWHCLFTRRYASTHSVGLCRVLGRNVFVCTFAVASAGIYLWILFGICLFLYHDIDDDCCTNAARTRSSRSRARAVVHGIWRSDSVWQYVFRTAHRSIRFTLDADDQFCDRALFGLALRHYCAGQKTSRNQGVASIATNFSS